MSKEEELDQLLQSVGVDCVERNLRKKHTISILSGGSELFFDVRSTRDECRQSAINFLIPLGDERNRGWEEEAEYEKKLVDSTVDEMFLTYDFLKEIDGLEDRVREVLTRGFHPISLTYALAIIVSHLYSNNTIIDWELNKEKPWIQSRRNELQFVRVRPCGDQYQKKTYLGIYLGDGVTGVSAKVVDRKIIVSPGSSNPMIFIPETKTIVFGRESWWGKISNPEEFGEISVDEISNVWYVSALRELQENMIKN